MRSALDNLVRIGKLKEEPADAREIAGLVASADERLTDAGNSSLSLSSRFDLAYNATHALALAALRARGYRSEQRYLVFQLLPQTLDLANDQWRVLDTAHRRRNAIEYEGIVEVDETLVEAMLRVATEMRRRLESLT